MYRNPVFQTFFLFVMFFGLINPVVNAGENTEPSSEARSGINWYWEDHVLTTIKSAGQWSNLSVLGAGAASTILSHQFNGEVSDKVGNGEKILMNEKTAEDFSTLGNGIFSAGVLVTQLFFDNENGLKHSRALLLSTISHVTLAFAVQRERPDGDGAFLPYDSSFPSGHASASFATATSLAYAYGWPIGIPAYLLAGAMSFSRVELNRHFLSDIIAGATLGIFWGRSNYTAEEQNRVVWTPSILPGGAGLSASLIF